MATGRGEAYRSEKRRGPSWDFGVFEGFQPDGEPSCLVLFSDVAFEVQCLGNTEDSAHTSASGKTHIQLIQAANI